MDIISQAFTSVTNAQSARKAVAKIPYSRINHEIFKILETYGFVDGVERGGKKDKKYLSVSLLYNEDKSGKLHEVKRISKPGKRVYAGYRELRWPQGVLIIISTPRGIMPAHKAKKQKLGGELIVSVV